MQYYRWNFARALGFVNNCRYFLISRNDLEGAYRKSVFGMQMGAIVIQDGWAQEMGWRMSERNGVQWNFSPLLTSPPSTSLQFF